MLFLPADFPLIIPLNNLLILLLDIKKRRHPYHERMAPLLTLLMQLHLQLHLLLQLHLHLLLVNRRHRHAAVNQAATGRRWHVRSGSGGDGDRLARIVAQTQLVGHRQTDVMACSTVSIRHAAARRLRPVAEVPYLRGRIIETKSIVEGENGEKAINSPSFSGER